MTMMCQDNIDKKIVRHSESSMSSVKSNNIVDKYTQKTPRTTSCNNHSVYTFRNLKISSLPLILSVVFFLSVGFAAHCIRHINIGMQDISHNVEAATQRIEIRV